MSPLMRTHFDRVLAQLDESVLEMGSRARRAVASGLQAFLENDHELAAEVIAGDSVINALRYRIEKQCYALLAMEQPVARDMRAIVAALSVVSELERVADHGKRIARTSQRTAHEPRLVPVINLRQMGEAALAMVDRALEALARRDVVAAEAVCASDDHVDALYRQAFNMTLSCMLENARAIGAGTYVIQVGHELERVADRATNIAERAIYVETGELIELNV